MWPQGITILIGVWLFGFSRCSRIQRTRSCQQSNSRCLDGDVRLDRDVRMHAGHAVGQSGSGHLARRGTVLAGLSRRTCIRQYRFGCRFGIAGPRAKPAFRTIRGRVVSTLEWKLNHERRPLGEGCNAC